MSASDCPAASKSRMNSTASRVPRITGLPASTWGSTTMRSGQPLTVFDIKGVPGNRRQRIEAAVVGGGKQARGPHDAWIAADPFKGGFRVLITGPQRFERTVVFAASSKKVRRSCYVPSVR